MLNEPCQTKWMMTLSIKVKWIGVPHQENAQLLFWLTAQGSIADPTAKSTTLPPRPEPKRPHGGYMRSILESWSILESHQGIGTWRFTLPRIFFWCDSRIHWTACFLWAFVCKLASSSNSWNEPCLKTALRRVASMFLVNGSANCNAVGIHLKWQCSKHLSLIRSTSKVVRYSSHEGIARRLTKSYRDLQSVTTTAACIWRKASGGFLHWNSGITSVPHKSRHQLILSTLLDMLKASADKVERTTLEIFFDDHEMGLIGAVLKMRETMGYPPQSVFWSYVFVHWWKWTLVNHSMDWGPGAFYFSRTHMDATKLSPKGGSSGTVAVHVCLLWLSVIFFQCQPSPVIWYWCFMPDQLQRSTLQKV